MNTEDAASAANPLAATTAAADTSGAADISPATAFTPAGAPDQVTDIDLSHRAVDNDLRANTTVNQNKIDFNDPTISGADAVANALGMKTEDEAKTAAAKAAASKGDKPKS